MDQRIRTSVSDSWIAEIFSAKAALTGGVIRRNRKWVEAEVGLAAFESTVRARGFHLIEAGEQLVVICHSGPVHLRF